MRCPKCAEENGPLVTGWQRCHICGARLGPKAPLRSTLLFVLVFVVLYVPFLFLAEHWGLKPNSAQTVAIAVAAALEIAIGSWLRGRATHSARSPR